MEELLWLLLQLVPLVAECLVGLVCEVFVEISAHSFGELFQRRIPAALGCVLLGAALGGISLLILPQVLIGDPAARRANLIVSPILAGFVMTGIGVFRHTPSTITA